MNTQLIITLSNTTASQVLEQAKIKHYEVSQIIEKAILCLDESKTSVPLHVLKRNYQLIVENSASLEMYINAAHSFDELAEVYLSFKTDLNTYPSFKTDFTEYTQLRLTSAILDDKLLVPERTSPIDAFSICYKEF